ncbi:MAG: glutamate 5-kinase [Clostridiales bacterium]|nr:glutamate 5-kinase [Clostridiales bacterium]
MRSNLKYYKRIIVKVGTTILTLNAEQQISLNLRRMEKLSWVLTALRNEGKEIILVSSGAIAVGVERLNLKSRPRDTRGKQAASAVGQAVLMQIYQNFFSLYNQKVAQILLTRDVIEDEIRKLNARNTFFTLLSMNVIPIVNANDTISTDELDFSDNDTLSAYVACITNSELLIILSDIDGVYDSDPRENPGAKQIEDTRGVTEELMIMANESVSGFGTGGMITKLSAAKMATESGIDTIIASGSDPTVLFSIFNGEKNGTMFGKC